MDPRGTGLATGAGESKPMNEYDPAQSFAMQNIERLTRIEEKVNGISTSATNADAGYRDHEFRIRALERFRWSQPVTALTSIISAAGAITAAYFAAKGGS